MLDTYVKPLQVQTKTEAVYIMLKESIITGELPPGERIVLRQLAKKIEISGIPIREAIKQLESEGLVTVSPHSEIIVTKLSPEEFAELAGIRAILESYAAGLTAQKQGAKVISLLQECTENMKFAVEANDYRAYGKLDKQFHELLCANCGDELDKMIRRLANRTERARALFVMDPLRMKNSYAEHLSIVEAIKMANPQRAEASMREHKQNSFESYYQHQFTDCKEDAE